MVKKKAQSSMEFLILMGFLTFVIITIVGTGFYYSTTINDRVRSSEISNYANKITSTSEMVFYSGEPSKSTISAYLPDGISNIEIIEDNLVITYSISSGQNKIAYKSMVPIIEDFANQLSTVSGVKSIEITANETHAVISQN